MSDDKQHTMPELRVDANGVIVSYHGKHLDMPEHAGPYPTPDLLAFRDEMAAGIASLRLQLSILEAELCELNECIVASKTLDLERNTGYTVTMTNTEQPQATVWLITTWSRETGNTKVIGIVRDHTEALQALKGYMWPHLKYGTGAMNMDATQLSSFRKTWNDGCPFKLISAWNGHRLGLYIELVEHRLGLTDAAKLLVQCPI